MASKLVGNRLPKKIRVVGKLRRVTMIGNRIARSRIAAGYTSQQVFATALGVSRGLVGQWESHKKKPGRDNLAKIAGLCGVSMEYLQGTSAGMGRVLTISVEREVQLILAFRRMSILQQQRLAEFIAEAVKARNEIELESEPT